VIAHLPERAQSWSKKLTTPLIGGNMKSLKPTIHAVVSTLLLLGPALRSARPSPIRNSPPNSLRAARRLMGGLLTAGPLKSPGVAERRPVVPVGRSVRLRILAEAFPATASPSVPAVLSPTVHLPRAAATSRFGAAQPDKSVGTVFSSNGACQSCRQTGPRDSRKA
jgi:hypothetical protein